MARIADRETAARVFGTKVNHPPPPAGWPGPFPELSPNPNAARTGPGRDGLVIARERWETMGPTELHRELEFLNEKVPGSRTHQALAIFVRDRVPGMIRAREGKAFI